MSNTASKKGSDGPVEFRSPFAPWMEIAWSQKGIKLNPPDPLLKMLRMSAQFVTRELTSQSVPYVAKPVQQIINLERDSLARNNAGIAKYFDGLKSDPSLNKKHRSYDVGATNLTNDGWTPYVNAWCAAFVNYCLKQAGAPYLNYATAKSWLDFGTPVSAPVYGCVTVVKPVKSTGGGTGHVAFFVARHGNKIQILGGNQAHEVKVSPRNATDVLGFRWPTTIEAYLAAHRPPTSVK